MQNSNVQNEKQFKMNFIDVLKSYLKEQAIPLIVLLLMIVISSLISPVFLSKNNAQNFVVQIAVTMVVSMGMFSVILTGGIDLSVGSLVALSGVLTAGLMRTMSVGWALLLSIVICTLLGAFTGLIVARLKIAPFIVTLGMLSFVSGLAYWYTDSSPISWRSLEGANVIKFIGSSKLFGIPMLAIIWIVMVIIAMFIMRRTIVGRIMYAIGGNNTAARLSGIDIKKWNVFPYAFSGLCCGLAGILLMSRLGVGSPMSGKGLELDCIAAVVIGGTSFNGGIGNVSGVVIGVFILGIINNILDLMNVPAYPQLMLKGVIIVLAVVLSTIRENKQR